VDSQISNPPAAAAVAAFLGTASLAARVEHYAILNVAMVML
jgi:hypothetical protein